MKNAATYGHDHSIYPGIYVPFMPEKDLKEELKHTHEKDILHPPVKVTEHETFFIIELEIPGVKREEFLVEADGNALSVYVVHNNDKKHPAEKFLSQKINHTCFDKQILLDQNVDAEFIIAEYLAGILRLHVPKTSQPAKVSHAQVIVY